jgi:hypothetical protein
MSFRFKGTIPAPRIASEVSDVKLIVMKFYNSGNKRGHPGSYCHGRKRHIHRKA